MSSTEGEMYMPNNGGPDILAATRFFRVMLLLLLSWFCIQNLRNLMY